MSTKHGSPGAGYDPNIDHFHDGLHDDELREQIASPVHGLRGRRDDDGEDVHRNIWHLKRSNDGPGLEKKDSGRGDHETFEDERDREGRK